MVSNNDDQIEHDCLFDQVLDDIINYVDKDIFTRPHQVLAYCMRPLKRRNSSMESSIGIHTKFTFRTLRTMNITVDELLSFSAPIDLVERYEIYFDNPTEEVDNEIYYKCAPSYFGHFCQYNLSSYLNFAEIVKKTLKNKPVVSHHTMEMTCYTHLQCKYKFSSIVCLDWREICDGNPDCNDGIDERDCSLLESIKCNWNEFRCQNGMCIPKEFFEDNPLNPDCMDGTDEIRSTDELFYSDQCYRDPAFRCEERRRTKGVGFSCGDGQFSNRFTIEMNLKKKCRNKRDALVNKHIFDFERMNMSGICWQALRCMEIYRYSNMWNCEECPETVIIGDPCLDYLDDFPVKLCLYRSIPLWAGHIYFIFEPTSDEPLPYQVCYNNSLCSLKSYPLMSRRSCEYFVEGNTEDKTQRITNLMKTCQHIFSDEYQFDCNETSAYHCLNSSKCIDKNNLVDGFPDCPLDDDEDTSESCQLNDVNHRFRCTSEEKCLSLWLVLDGNKDCIGGEDERISGEKKLAIPFSRLCNKYVDLKSLILTNGQNDTDETDCEQWQCDNRYTRCDGKWDCANGADEVSCPDSLCPPGEHRCLSASTQQPICLPLELVGDDIIDCLGSYDERDFCRSWQLRLPDIRYRCVTKNNCMDLNSVCSPTHAKYVCKDDDYHVLCETCSTNWSSLCAYEDKGDREILTKFPYFQLTSDQSSTIVLKTPPTTTSTTKTTTVSTTISETLTRSISERAWFCNRGISIYLYGRHYCLCPPSYYGDRCENQNERVSLTLKIRKENQLKTWSQTFRFVVLLKDNDESIHSFDYFIYSVKSQCIFNIYLLYRHRPKDQRKNYTVHVDAYLLNPLEYHSSWLLSVPYRFLPVNRLASLVLIPTKKQIVSNDECPIDCIHGECVSYVNKNVEYCHCQSSWSGVHCNISMECQCSMDSICVGMISNRSICVCPLEKFGSRCLLRRSACESYRCLNGGSCMLGDERVSSNSFFCVCPPGYSGIQCEIVEREIHLSFDRVKIPSTILLHHIKTSEDQHPIRTTLFKNIPVYENKLFYRTSLLFHILFVEFDEQIYLSVLQRINNSIEMISGSINSENRCYSIDDLFNSSLITWPLLRRVKYYHVPCRRDKNLVCFYDGEMMCICKSGKYADCFEFDQNLAQNCRGSDFCLNGARCFQDRPDCPSEMICACPDCYYGTRCQLTNTLFGYSLDAILGYHILPYVSLSNQSMTLRLSTVVVSIMSAIGVVDGTLSLMTFKNQSSWKSGCGIYLFSMSIISLLVMIFLMLKFWFLVLSQMAVIVHPTIILIECVTVDFLIRSLLSTYNWLSGCVAIERVFILLKGIHFNTAKSRYIARWTIFVILIFIVSTSIQESIYRKVIEEPEESRQWCTISYSDRHIWTINIISNIIHFAVPFLINFLSAVIIVVLTSRRRAKSSFEHFANKQVLKSQSQQYKHLFISPCIFIILNVPNLVLNLLTDCMKSTREPWLFLAIYFASFVPAMLTFVVFVVPSNAYKHEFYLVMKRLCT